MVVRSTTPHALWAWLALLFPLWGCSILVEPLSESLRCERAEGSPEVCPQGLACRDGRCQLLCGAELCGDGIDNDCDGQIDEPELLVAEICGDGLDNDCDGQVDEADPLVPDICGDGVDNNCDGEIDEGSDHDNDGFSWCGDTRIAGGAELVDCDDYNPNAYPNAPEICDGADNNCDGIYDEANPALCGEGQICTGQRCITPSCAVANSGITCGAGERCDLTLQRCVAALPCTADSCGADEYCDPADMLCKKRTPSSNGAPCLKDEDCFSGSCIDAAALRLAAGARVCGQACCDDSDCPETERCFASGTGARSCLPRSVVPNTLVTQCTTDASCPSPAICGLYKEQALEQEPFITKRELVTSVCRADDLGGQTLGEPCFSYASCNSRACVQSPSFGMICSTMCGTSSDCQAFAERAGTRLSPEHAYCRYLPVTLDPTAPLLDYAAMCVLDLRGDTGPGAYGAECDEASDCRDGGCVGAMRTKKGRCTPTCCNDSQCGEAVTGKPTRCRPFAFGVRYQMRCAL